MAVPDPEMLRAIHQISEALGSYERSKILYLWEISDTDNTAAHIKETLKSKAGVWVQPGRCGASFEIRAGSTQIQESPVSRYKFASDPRGECVIIDCVGNDGEMMAHAFKSLHFNVTLHKWLNLVETVSTLRKVFQRSPDRSGDGFVCCIISRAIDNRLQATDMNCEGLRLEDVRRFFNGDACPALVGKPKLFFIQSYTVSDFQPCDVENRWDDGWETDGGAVGCPTPLVAPLPNAPGRTCGTLLLFPTPAGQRPW
ncbi:CASP8 and FADD-like apoptosis regulator [Syngnathoides biaculeatus]|uniref:CASP8 and FADD-like apoptosis regulator n=1 Tax=Syngnathoides biaculeatus TaxID=300417 RepID=UPI002ADD7576|nr:CASP8 and FADD-like apoptosis regulator [Syngnathoides biaculeatus]